MGGYGLSKGRTVKGQQRADRPLYRAVAWHAGNRAYASPIGDLESLGAASERARKYQGRAAVFKENGDLLHEFEADGKLIPPNSAQSILEWITEAAAVVPELTADTDLDDYDKQMAEYNAMCAKLIERLAQLIATGQQNH